MNEPETLLKRKEQLENRLKELYEIIKSDNTITPELGKTILEIDNIKKEICRLKGHDFDEWKQYMNLTGYGYYYSRKCTYCGFTEISYTKPENYNSDIITINKM